MPDLIATHGQVLQRLAQDWPATLRGFLDHPRHHGMEPAGAADLVAASELLLQPIRSPQRDVHALVSDRGNHAVVDRRHAAADDSLDQAADVERAPRELDKVISG